MQLHILAIGRMKKSSEAAMVTDYLKRLPKGSQIFECESRLPYGTARQSDESQKLLSLYEAKKPKSSKLILADPNGQNLSSPALAEMISSWRDHGCGAAFFAIGGADGHSAALHEKADKVISFGAATWPHMLFRVMLAEQLYRAETIIANHPYHKV